jgi:hypothetical protein
MNFAAPKIHNILVLAIAAKVPYYAEISTDHYQLLRASD